MSKQERIDSAVAVELGKFARVSSNLERAREEGRISEHDRDERVARAEQRTANAIAYIAGEKRPKQRVQQPLDAGGVIVWFETSHQKMTPDAGKVG